MPDPAREILDDLERLVTTTREETVNRMQREIEDAIGRASEEFKERQLAIVKMLEKEERK